MRFRNYHLRKRFSCTLGLVVGKLDRFCYLEWLFWNSMIRIVWHAYMVIKRNGHFLARNHWVRTPGTKQYDQKLTFSYFRCCQNEILSKKVRFSIFYVGNFKRIKVTFFIFGTKLGNCSDLMATITTLTRKKLASIDVLDSLVMSFAFLVDDFFNLD